MSVIDQADATSTDDGSRASRDGSPYAPLPVVQGPLDLVEPALFVLGEWHGFLLPPKPNWTIPCYVGDAVSQLCRRDLLLVKGSQVEGAPRTCPYPFIAAGQDITS
jgi:hypothetical protein